MSELIAFLNRSINSIEESVPALLIERHLPSGGGVSHSKFDIEVDGRVECGFGGEAHAVSSYEIREQVCELVFYSHPTGGGLADGGIEFLKLIGKRDHRR